MNISLIIKIIIILCLLYIGVVAFVYIKQRSLLYLPGVDNYEDERLIINTNQVFIQNKEGDELRSIFFKHPNSIKTTLLMFHGNAGPIENRFYKVNKLSKYEQNILLISWRGYSGNSGKPTEQGLYSDAEAAIQWLKNQNILPKDIIIYGESLGTAVALEMASKYQFKGIILEAPFTSMIDAAKHHYPYLPVSWMLKDKFLSSFKIKQNFSAIFIIHAKGDEVVPFWMGEKMYEMANEPKMKLFINENKHLVTYDENLMNNMDNFYNLLKR